LINNILSYLKFLLHIKLKEWRSGYRLFVYCRENKCQISQISNITGDLSRLKVGKGTVINSYANFRFKQGSITIGQECLFGQNTTILANTYELIPGMPISSERMYSKDVTIGDHVWVGANVVILPGVSIGDNSVVGSSAVVTKNVPAGEIWGGVPAKKISDKL
jgi:acetyltransferase-like isoleucine patch superfamily enzyme